MVVNMEVNRVKLTQTIRKLAKLDFKNLIKKTSLIEENESEYAKNKINQIDDVFSVHSLDKFITIDVKKGKSVFLRNFITENDDNNFDFTVNYRKGNLKITIEKKTINERNFEELVKLMYLHSINY